MTEPNNELLKYLQKTVAEVDGRLDDLIKAIYGYPELGQKGFREEVQKNISKCQEDVHKATETLNALLQERREEAAERRGRDASMKRFMSFTGISSLVTFLTVVGGIIAILSSIGILGGP
jgi:hypothetical protein